MCKVLGKKTKYSHCPQGVYALWEMNTYVHTGKDVEKDRVLETELESGKNKVSKSEGRNFQEESQGQTESIAEGYRVNKKG